MVEGQSARALARYKAWANERTYAVVLGLPGDEITRQRQTLFGSIVHTLNHNFVIDDVWKAHLEGREHGYTARNTKTPPALADLYAAQCEMDAWWIRFSETTSDEAMAERIDFTFVGGGEGSMTRGEILVHVVNHNSYHRGFVADMMFQIPVKPDPADLPVFLRDVPQGP